jgi:hypothetical protein
MKDIKILSVNKERYRLNGIHRQTKQPIEKADSGIDKVS